MIGKLFKAVLTLVVLGLIGLGFYLAQSGHARAWYFSYELGELTDNTSFKEAEGQIDKDIKPADAAKSPEETYGKFVRWDGQITDVRTLHGKLKVIHLLARDETPFAVVTDQDLAGLETGDVARTWGLHKNLLFSIETDGKSVPALLAVEIDEAPSTFDLLKDLKDTAEDLLD